MIVVSSIDKMEILIPAPGVTRGEVKIKAFPKGELDGGKLKIYTELSEDSKAMQDKFGIDLEITESIMLSKQFDIDKTERSQKNGMVIITIPAAADIRSID